MVEHGDGWNYWVKKSRFSLLSNEEHQEFIVGLKRNGLLLVRFMEERAGIKE